MQDKGCHLVDGHVTSPVIGGHGNRDRVDARAGIERPGRHARLAGPRVANDGRVRPRASKSGNPSLVPGLSDELVERNVNPGELSVDEERSERPSLIQLCEQSTSQDVVAFGR